jgi:hypothetical protein
MPAMRKFTGLVMPDVVSVTLVFATSIAFGNFLDREKGRDAWLAGIFGGLAILNSELVGALWLMIVLAIGMMRRFRLLRRPAFWGMCILILAASTLRGGLFAMSDPKETLQSYAIQFGSAVGWGGGALMIIGFFIKMGREGDFAGRWVTAVALLIVSIKSRSVLLALPAVLMFALAGGFWLVEWVASRPGWGGRGGAIRAPFAAILGALTLVSATGAWTKEPCTGFAPLAETLIEDSTPEDTVLVSSDPSGEERFIAELAMREQRPGHTVLCGTQLLAKPGKKFIANEPAFLDDQAVFDLLISGKIKYVVLDDAVPDEERREHHYQIRRAIEEHLTRFWIIASCPVTRDGVTQRAPAKLYKIK